MSRSSVTIIAKRRDKRQDGQQRRFFCIPMSCKCQLLIVIIIVFIQSTWNVSLSFSCSWITNSKTTCRKNTCLNINFNNNIVKTVHTSNNNNFNNDNNNNKINLDNLLQIEDEHQSLSRNNFFKKCQQILSTTVFVSSLLAIQQPTVVYGACLQGDVSDDCIGVYKVPLDDEIIEYINTPEKLIQYAPGIRYVEPIQYPKSLSIAIQQLQQIQNDEITSLQSLLLKGDLLNLGKIILYISPRITLAGRVIIQSLENDLEKLQLQSQQQQEQSTTTESNKRKKKRNNIESNPTITIDNLVYSIYRIQITHTDVLSSLGECDITIGQGIRGELGSITATQLVLLEIITEIISNYNTFLKSVPTNYITIASTSSSSSSSSSSKGKGKE